MHIITYLYFCVRHEQRKHTDSKWKHNECASQRRLGYRYFWHLLTYLTYLLTYLLTHTLPDAESFLRS